jgi:Trypsin
LAIPIVSNNRPRSTPQRDWLGPSVLRTSGEEETINGRRMRRRIVLAIAFGLFASLTPTVLADEVGLVDPATGEWYLQLEGGGTTSFFYGDPGDHPFSGDWNCDGIDTPGLYRRTDGFVYLRNANSQGNANIRFFFGDPGDLPLAGDFNGDGCDTVSIYRPSESRIYVINELGANDGGLGAAEFSFLFGNPGDSPVVGDFNADGTDEIGLYRESTGFFYYRDSLTTGIASNQFFFGNPGDRFVAGDWGIPDSEDTPGVFRPSVASFYLKHSNTEGVADESFAFGQSPWLPVGGQWGDGSPGTGQTSKNEGGSTGSAGSTGAGSGEPTDQRTGDFAFAIESPPIEATPENIAALLAAADAEENSTSDLEITPARQQFDPQYLGQGQPLWSTQWSGYLPYQELPTSVGLLDLWRDSGAGFQRLGGHCSATVISRDIVVTAAHCIRQTGANGFVFYPDKWGFQAKYGSWAGVSFRVPTFYDQGIAQNALWSEAFDFAFVKLAPNSLGQHVGDVVGSHRVLYNAHSVQGNLPRRSIGYPVEGFYGTNAAPYPCSLQSCVPYSNQTTSSQGTEVHWGNGWHSSGMGTYMHGGNSGGPVLVWYNSQWWLAGVVSNGGFLIPCPAGQACNSNRAYYMRNLWGPSFRNGNFSGSFEYEWAQASLLP